MPDIKISELAPAAGKQLTDMLPESGGTPFDTYRLSVGQLTNAGRTGLTGGGSTNLDGVPTIAEGVTQQWNVIIGNVLYPYQLQVGVAAQSLPNVVRPLDFDNPNNTRIFQRLSIYGTIDATTLGNGLIVQTSALNFAVRTIVGTAAEVAVANGAGIADNPTISLPSALTFTGKTVTGGSFSGPAISGGTISGATISGSTITGISPVLTLSTDASGSATFTNLGSATLALTLATVNSNVGSFGSATAAPVLTVNGKGLVTAAAAVTITPAFSSITGTPTSAVGYGITNGAQIDALGALATNGIIARTTTSTIAARTLTGTANQVLISNGDGVSANPTFSLPQSIDTAATPTFATITLNGLTASRLLSTDGSKVTASNALLTTNGFVYASGSGALASTAAATDGQVLIGRTSGGAPAAATISGTSNQIVVTNGANSITLSLASGTFTGFANPTASAGLTAVNGSATTAMRSDGAPAIDVTIVPTWTGAHTFSAKPLTISGTQSAAAWTTSGAQLRVAAASLTDTSSSGTVAVTAANAFGVPTLLASSSTTYTDSATVYIAGAPTASTNVTQTNPWSLLIGAGNVKLGGNLTVAGGTVTINDITLVRTNGTTLTINQGLATGGALATNALTATTGAFSNTTEATTGGAGAVTVAGGLFAAKSLVSTGTFQLSSTARSSGTAAYFTVTAPADIGITTATESVGVSFVGSARAWVDGTVAVQREHLITAPTYNKTTASATFTKAATLAIAGAPIAGSGVTIANPYTFWVQTGTAQFDGAVVATSTLAVSGHTTFEGVTSTGATGSGRLVYDTSPSLTTPTLGVAVATTINGNTFTAGSYTLTGTAAKTLTFTNTLTLSGTDGTTMTFPGTTTTVAGLGTTQSFTGVNTFTQPLLVNRTTTSGIAVIDFITANGSADWVLGTNVFGLATTTDFDIASGVVGSSSFNINNATGAIKLPLLTTNGVLQTSGGNGAVSVSNTIAGLTTTGTLTTAAITASGTITASSAIYTLSGTTIGSGSAIWWGSDTVGGLFFNVPTGKRITFGINNANRMIIDPSFVSFSALLSGSSGISMSGTFSFSGDTVIGGNLTVNGTTIFRTTTVTDTTTWTPAADGCDISYQLNTQGAGTLTMNAPTSTATPSNGQKLMLKIKSTSVQTYAWNSAYVSGTDVILPTVSSGAGKIDNIWLVYDAVNSKWECVQVARGY